MNRNALFFISLLIPFSAMSQQSGPTKPSEIEKLERRVAALESQYKSVDVSLNRIIAMLEAGRPRTPVVIELPVPTSLTEITTFEGSAFHVDDYAQVGAQPAFPELRDVKVDPKRLAEVISSACQSLTNGMKNGRQLQLTSVLKPDNKSGTPLMTIYLKKIICSD